MNLRKEISKYYYSSALCDLKLMNENIIEGGITYNSLLYLELIFCMDGKCTPSSLAKLLHVSKPAVTSKINELLSQGLVTKKADPNDGRRCFISVNEDVMPKYKVYRKQDQTAAKRLEESYSSEEIEKFCEMLSVISAVNFEDIGDFLDDRE